MRDCSDSSRLQKHLQKHKEQSDHKEAPEICSFLCVFAGGTTSGKPVPDEMDLALERDTPL